MRRLLILATAALCFSVTASAQTLRTHRAIPRANASTVTLSRPAGLPVELIPTAPFRQALPGDGGFSAVDTDSLTESQILHRIGRIYRYQSDILTAQAEGNNERAERLLELAMTELSTLLQHPGVMDRPRFQEMYRSIVGEYEQFYGVASDSLNVQYGDIYQFRADIFSALNDVDRPLLEDVMMPKLHMAETVIPMTMNRLVQNSIAFLMREPNKHLYRWMSRAETYFPMIEQILKEEKVPDELKYLAMIESGLNPQAVSWAKAVGMWQFMPATGAEYGLDINSWVDERRDPEAATRAAARHLRDLYRTFGDWQLALAAYNCGTGNVQKALRRYGNQRATFWQIYDYLPRETRNYVPMFIATSLVVSNPNEFHLARVEPGPKYEYHHVPVQGQLSLESIADMAGTDVNTIRALNPALRRSTLPPSKNPYRVRLPLGTYDRFAASYRDMPATMRQLREVEYTVRRGETLTKIAKKHGVTVSALMEANNLRSRTVKSGTRLIVPVPQYVEVQKVELADARPVTVQYGERIVRPIAIGRPEDLPTRAPQQEYQAPITRASDTSTEERAEPTRRTSTREATAETRVSYRVRKGDTLARIAAKYGVTIADLRKWNKIRNNRLLSGQTLKIYPKGRGADEEVQQEEEPRVQQASARSTQREAPAVTTTHRVRRGETLASIAERYNVSIGDLKEWNNLRGSTIKSGQRLKIRGGSAREETTTAKATTPKAKKAKAVTYRVQRGDTLGKIAEKHGVSVTDLKKWNKLRSNSIRPGQRLKVQA